MNLFPHQQLAVEAMVAQDSFLLADEPGLGKTAPVAMAACVRAARMNGAKIMVICPRNVVKHWKATFEALYPSSTSNIFVTNFEQLKNITAADMAGVGVLIIDEMHKLKNETSARFERLHELWINLSKACAWSGQQLVVYGTTGTPVYSYPIDLMTDLILLRKLEMYQVPMFKARYCDPKPRNLPGKSSVFDFRGGTNLDELRQACAPFIMRRGWKDAGIQMPAITMTEMNVNEKIKDAEYFKASEDFKAYYVAQGGRPQGAGMARFTVYRRILARAKAPAVVEQVVDDVKSGQHSFVLTEFREAAQLIFDRLQAEGVPAGLIMGGQSATARQGIIDAFVNSRTPAVIVATTDSIGEGTDGLQKVCHLVNVVDSDFDPAMFVQSIRRLWRIGQRHPVHVRRFVVENDAMEDFITSNLAKKEANMRALGLEDSVSFTQLSKRGG